MGWYKFEFRHGPGHQGRTVEYRWYNGTLSDEEQRDEMREIAHESYVEDWVCNCEPVEKLPDDVREQFIKKYRGYITHGQAMLKRLGVEQ